jgi:hypothetical protein
MRYITNNNNIAMEDFSDILNEFDGVELTFLKSHKEEFEFEATEQLVCYDHLQEAADHPFQTSQVKKCPIESYKIVAEGEDVKTVYEMVIDISVST